MRWQGMVHDVFTGVEMVDNALACSEGWLVAVNGMRM